MPSRKQDPDGSIMEDAYDLGLDDSSSDEEAAEAEVVRDSGNVDGNNSRRVSGVRQEKTRRGSGGRNKHKQTTPSPTGLTVRRRKTPGSGSISGMTTPTPNNNSKKKTTKSKKRGKEVEPATIIKVTSHGPASKYDEASVDKAYRLRHHITSADDSDDEWDWDDPDWQQALEEHEEILSILKWESISVEPEYVESDPTGLTDKVIEGAPEGWKPHGPPPGWKPRKLKAGVDPEFHLVDNPGKWPPYIYRQAYKNATSKTGYRYHALPTGCTPVPQRELAGTKFRICGSWLFNYDGTWTSPAGSNFRNGADKDNMFPKERRGSLCAETLKKLGMSALRMSNPALGGKVDALFFEQLILPMCDTERSGIDDDPRMPFYFPCSIWTNKYATSDLRLGDTYGHKYENVSVQDLVRFDGIVSMDASLGNSNGALYRRWDPECKQYDEDIAEAMNITRFQQIKQVYKMCDNSENPKKGQPNFDPAYKFEFVFRVMCHNVNAITYKAEDDNTGDETTFPFGAFGEAGTGIISKVDKPHTSRGGQVVIVSDVHRVRPRAFLPRHKLYEKTMEGQTMGPTEVHMILKKFDKMVVTPQYPSDHPSRKVKPYDLHTFKPNPLFRGKGIFFGKPHTTWDNFFSGDSIHKWCGENGFGMTNTVARNSLPKDVADKYLQKLSTSGKDPQMCKAARWIEPVVLSKRVGDTGNVMTLVSFQSTSSCNIASVNAYNSCYLYAKKRERGRGQYKREWGIEMNQARDIYLGSYMRIDSIDHAIHNLHMRYVSQKYWHQGMILGKAWVKIVAYDVYKECAEGNLDPSWKCDPIDAADFQEQLSLQKCQYCPSNRMYPGDDSMRKATQEATDDRIGNQGSIVGSPVTPLNNKKRKVSVPSDATTTSSGVSMIHILNNKDRLIGNLDALFKHMRSVKRFPNKNTVQCDVCSGRTNTYCGICKRPLHYLTQHSKATIIYGACFVQFHNTSFFGKCYCDKEMAGLTEKEFTLADTPEQKKNSREIQEIQQSASSSSNTNTTATTPSIPAAATTVVATPTRTTRSTTAAAAAVAAETDLPSSEDEIDVGEDAQRIFESLLSEKEGNNNGAAEEEDDNTLLAMAASENPAGQKDDNDTGRMEAV